MNGRLSKESEDIPSSYFGPNQRIVNFICKRDMRY